MFSIFESNKICAYLKHFKIKEQWNLKCIYSFHKKSFHFSYILILYSDALNLNCFLITKYLNDVLTHTRENKEHSKINGIFTRSSCQTLTSLVTQIIMLQTKYCYSEFNFNLSQQQSAVTTWHDSLISLGQWLTSPLMMLNIAWGGRKYVQLISSGNSS